MQQPVLVGIQPIQEHHGTAIRCRISCFRENRRIQTAIVELNIYLEFSKDTHGYVQPFLQHERLPVFFMSLKQAGTYDVELLAFSRRAKQNLNNKSAGSISLEECLYTPLLPHDYV
jgi:hypothetical protein